MWRFIRSIIASLCISLACLVTPAWGQGQTGQGGGTSSDTSQRTPAIAYAVALLSTIVIMVIVCTPSRKR
jgi:hypothetical protein